MPKRRDPPKATTRRGAPKTQEKLRSLAIEILLKPRCSADLQTAYLISCVDCAIETSMLSEFSAYVQRFPDWLQQGAGVDAGVDWPEEIEDSEARG